MHQVHNNNRPLEGAYAGIDHVSLRRFEKSCAKKPAYPGLQRRAMREPQLVIIRNKYTKEVVDLDVSDNSSSFLLYVNKASNYFHAAPLLKYMYLLFFLALKFHAGFCFSRPFFESFQIH